MSTFYQSLKRVISLLAIMLFAINAHAIVANSIQSGSWINTTTWDCNCVPAPTDDVIIGNGHEVRLADSVMINSVTINAGGLLNNNSYVLTVAGDYIINGDHVGNDRTELTGIGTNIGGIGTIHSAELRLSGGNKTILATARLTKAFGIVSVKSGVIVNNLGTITIGSVLTGVDPTSQWVNGVNATLNIGGAVFETNGVFDATSPGNTVRYYGVDSQQINNTIGSTYYNLFLEASGVKTLGSDVTINGDFVIYSSTFDLGGFTMYLKGDWLNTGVFVNSNGSVIMNGLSDQTITNNQGEVFYHLRVEKPMGDLILQNQVTVINHLEMMVGNINTDTTKLILGTSIANEGNLTYFSGVIIGRLARWVNTLSSGYLFPIGIATSYYPAMVTFNAITGGLLTVEYNETPPGINGLPLLDNTVTLNNTFVEGYWDLSASNGLLSFDYNVEFSGNGYTSFPIIPMTRVLTRLNDASAWTANGIHSSAVGQTTKRDGVNMLPAQFAFSDSANCTGPVTSPIAGADSVCLNAFGIPYSVVNTPLSTYTWMATGGLVTFGQGTNAVMVDWGNTGMVGGVTVYETNSCTRGASVAYPVNIHPFSTTDITGKENVSEFTLGEPYNIVGAPGYNYTWSVVGGAVVAGQGTGTAIIDWGAAAIGAVCVIGSNGCGLADTMCMEINIYVPIISVQTGAWSDFNTWNCSCVPLVSSNVKIMNTHVVDVFQNTTVNHFEIQAGGVLSLNAVDLEVTGDLTIDGFFLGVGELLLSGAGANIDGTGQIANSGLLRITGGDKTILSSAFLTKSSNTLYMDGNITITNLGTITLEGDLTTNNQNATWDNAAGSYLNCKGQLLRYLGDLKANSYNNTVEYSGATNQIVKRPNSKDYYNVIINKLAGNARITKGMNAMNLTLTSGKLILGSNNFRIMAGGDVIGGDVNSYVQADSGGDFKRRTYNLGTYFFPVGDVDDFSPFWYTLNPGTVFRGSKPAGMHVNVTDAKHPNMASTGYITRYWTVKIHDVNAINYDATYQYVDADIVGSENTFLSQRWDGGWTSYEPVIAPSNTLFTSAGITTEPDEEDFTGGGGALLPIELISFTAKGLIDEVALEWSTSIEIDNDYYMVQRSYNGTDFEDIIKVSGVGNSYTLTKYYSLDGDPYIGLSYYRLKQVDKNGSYEYSEIVSVIFTRSSQTSIRVYPNPINKNVSLRIEIENLAKDVEVAITLLDHLGREVYSITKKPENDGFIKCMDMARQLTAGIYCVVAKCNNFVYKQKLVVSTSEEGSTK